MCELIPIINEKEVNAVDARLLHEFLEVKTDFKDWIRRRIESYGFNEGSEYKIVSLKNEQNLKGGRPSKEYHISIDMAKQLAMVEGNEKGKEARIYFLEVENKYKKLSEEVSRNRSINLQKAQMGFLAMIKPEDTECFMLANKFVNTITCDFLDQKYKSKNDMTPQELNLRDEILTRWIDAYKQSGSKSKANMITRLFYDLKQVGKYRHLNKVLEFSEH